jgi:hypothetical protein
MLQRLHHFTHKSRFSLCHPTLVVDDPGLTTSLYRENSNIALHTLKFHGRIICEKWCARSSETSAARGGEDYGEWSIHRRRSAACMGSWKQASSETTHVEELHAGRWHPAHQTLHPGSRAWGAH